MNSTSYSNAESDFMKADQDEVPKKKNFWNYLYEYCLIQWDGFTFFGFDDTKLGRINGAPVTFLGKFKSKRWLTFTFGTLFVVLYVVISEIQHLGEQKTQTISLIEDVNFHYDAKENLALLVANYFYVDEIFPRVQEYQVKNEQNAEVRQHSRLLPLAFEEWDQDDKDFFTWFMCKYSRVYYEETMYWWPIGFPSWTEKKHIEFGCKLMDFANDKIRIQFNIPFQYDPTPLNSTFVVSDPETANLLKDELDVRLEVSDEELQELNFKRSNDYRQQVFVYFDLEELAGLSVFSYAFHTRDGHDGSKYNNWEFTVREWDHFWNNEHTTMLFGTNTFVLGNNTVDMISVRVQPERIIMIEQ